MLEDQKELRIVQEDRYKPVIVVEVIEEYEDVVVKHQAGVPLHPDVAAFHQNTEVLHHQPINLVYRFDYTFSTSSCSPKIMLINNSLIFFKL